MDKENVFLLQTLDGWRVVMADNLDALYFWIGGDGLYTKRNQLNPEMVAEYFGGCSLIKNEYEAMEQARELFSNVTSKNRVLPILDVEMNYITGHETELFPLHLIPEEL
jgi:hypothetical protein